VIAYYVHHFDPFIFHVTQNIGPRWYGLAYVLAFLCSYLLLRVLSRRGYADLPVERVADFITGCALFGVILGGRLGYVFFYRPEMLLHPLSILQVWEGGMSSHGGMIALILFTLYYSRRHNISWLNLGDNLCVTAPLGLFFGRCANFINGELYGRAATVPWAMQFPKEIQEIPEKADHAIASVRAIDPSIVDADSIIAAAGRPEVKDALRSILTPRHPSQLYEAFFEGIVLFSILWLVRTRLRQPNGVLTGLFFICYAIFRIIIECFREPDASLIAGITRGQFFSIFLIVIGLAFVIGAKMKPNYPLRITARDPG
jgi:phosphatidylglycerol:prolipoprotein diacylglycerol transferase